MKIRQADRTDLDDLHRLVAGFREVLERRFPDDKILRSSLENLLVGGDAKFFFALDDESEAVGYIQQRYRYSLWLGGLEATLEDICVSSNSRSQCFGIRLEQFAIERAKEKGCKAIKLDTCESNCAVIDLYQKLGFTSGSSRFSNSRQLTIEKNLESGS